MWCQAYGYDRYGNRKVDARWGLTQGISEPSNFSAANNRVMDANWDYIDGRGNLTAMPFGTGVETFAYDAEDRLKSKSVGGVDTVCVYDAMGELAAEYGGTAMEFREVSGRFRGQATQSRYCALGIA